MTVFCKIKSIETLTCDTFKVLLRPASPVTFKAGQYLMVVMGEEDKRPFSIASSPCRYKGEELELHIGAAESNVYAYEVMELIKRAFDTENTIEVDVPHGNAWFREERTRPILLVAGGTGFSYVRSILEHCMNKNIDNPIYLYWGARSDKQLYALNEMIELAAKQENVHFIPSIENASKIWSGKVGNVLSTIKADFDSLENFDIYLAGRFEMAEAAREQFSLEKGAKRECMFADAYSLI